jgi:hypothetical protein
LTYSRERRAEPAMKLDLGMLRLEAVPGYRLHALVLVGPPTEVGATHDVAKPNASFSPNLVITRSEAQVEPGSLRRFVDEQRERLAVLPGFRHMDTELVRLADGRQGVLEHHCLQNSAGLQVEQLQLYAPSGGYAWVLTATHVAGAAFEATREQFEAMLRSARF